MIVAVVAVVGIMFLLLTSLYFVLLLPFMSFFTFGFCLTLSATATATATASLVLEAYLVNFSSLF